MRFTVIFVIIIGIVTSVWVADRRGDADREEGRVKLEIGNTEVVVEIAQTAEARQRGLSGRDGLGETEGLLFVFDELGLHSFWMKDMNFPIDIIWLDENLRVVSIKERAEPSSYPDRFSPTEPATYVLEVNAGFASTHQLKIDDQAKILK